jgi:hypothetical protein
MLNNAFFGYELEFGHQVIGQGLGKKGSRFQEQLFHHFEDDPVGNAFIGERFGRRINGLQRRSQALFVRFEQLHFGVRHGVGVVEHVDFAKNDHGHVELQAFTNPFVAWNQTSSRDPVSSVKVATSRLPRFCSTVLMLMILPIICTSADCF